MQSRIYIIYIFEHLRLADLRNTLSSIRVFAILSVQAPPVIGNNVGLESP